jgi:hypothetical protein
VGSDGESDEEYVYPWVCKVSSTCVTEGDVCEFLAPSGSGAAVPCRPGAVFAAVWFRQEEAGALVGDVSLSRSCWLCDHAIEA